MFWRLDGQLKVAIIFDLITIGLIISTLRVCRNLRLTNLR